MSYLTNLTVTYTAIASTPGFQPSDHTISWKFDDGTTDSGSSVTHTWTTAGSHLAVATATNNITRGTAASSKSIGVKNPPVFTVTTPSSISAPWVYTAYGAGLFVVVSSDGKIITSPDGINWTYRTQVTVQNYFYMKFLKFANNRFIMGSSRASGNASGPSQVWWSDDGISWTSATVEVSEFFYTVAFINGMWVAFPDYEGGITSDADMTVSMSTDNGLTWQTAQQVSEVGPPGSTKPFIVHTQITDAIWDGYQMCVSTSGDSTLMDIGVPGVPHAHNWVNLTQVFYPMNGSVFSEGVYEDLGYLQNTGNMGYTYPHIVSDGVYVSMWPQGASTVWAGEKRLKINGLITQTDNYGHYTSESSPQNHSPLQPIKILLDGTDLWALWSDPGTAVNYLYKDSFTPDLQPHWQLVVTTPVIPGETVGHLNDMASDGNGTLVAVGPPLYDNEYDGIIFRFA